MPPRLNKSGQPVGQRRLLNETLFLCQCSECIQYSFFDAATYEVHQGQKIPLATFKKHRQREARRELAFAHYRAETNGERHDFRIQDAAQESDASAPTAGEIPVPPRIRQYGRKRFGKSVFSKTRNSRYQIARKLSEADSLIGVASSQAIKKALEKAPLIFHKSPADGPSEPLESDLGLDSRTPSNYAMIKHEHDLTSTLRFFDGLSNQYISKYQASRIDRLRPRLEEERQKTHELKIQSWKHQWAIWQREEGRKVDTSAYFLSLKSMEPLSCLIFLLTATLHFLSNLSISELRFTLPSLALLLRLALKSSTSPDQFSVVASIPSDVRTVITSLRVDPKYTAFVCCPNCFSTYNFDASDPSSCPEFCPYQSVSQGNQCRRRLRKEKSPGISLPEREFLYQDVSHWIARMYARSDIEHYLDKELQHTSLPGTLSDIWDGDILQGFLGPDGRHFMDKPGVEGRLVFGLNMDGFNPYGNRLAGKQVTICGIYLVCFNLPIHLRYRPENVCLVGIVPGPNEPSKHQVNHVLKPLVDELLVLWHQGLYLSRTTKYPLGRPIRCALIPVICDLPAARRVAGLGGHSSDLFCSECLLPHSEINNLERATWKARSRDEHIRHAEEWRDASTEAARKEAFKKYGAKWSELLRLPYWDPTQFVVMDSMHGFYLRLFQRHIKDVWGMNVKLLDGNGVPVLDLSEEEMAEARHTIRFGKLKDLKALSKIQLQYSCREVEIHYGGAKSTLLKRLVNYRVKQGWFSEDGSCLNNATLNSVDTNHFPAKVVDMNVDLSPEVVASNNGSGPWQAQSRTSLDLIQPDIDAEPLVPAEFLFTDSHFELSKADIRHGEPPLPQSDSAEHPTRSETQSLDDKELDILYTGTKDKIKKMELSKLIDLCSYKLKGNREEYASKSKSALINLIFQSRENAGIVTKRGRPRTAKPLALENHSCYLASPLPLADSRTISPTEKTDKSGTAGHLLNLTPDITEHTLQKLSHVYQKGTKTALKSTSKYLLAVLCAMKFKHSVDYYEDKQKDELLETIRESRLQDGIIDEDEKLLEKESDQEVVVLGQETLQAIRHDMENISLPSWFTPAPRHPGEIKWGKFKADEWKAFCLVNLPASLTRLWGSKPHDDRHYQMLENFLHLVTAVKIANKRHLNMEDINCYDIHIEKYMTGFVKLYPFIDLSPYQHLALHYSAHLRRFGPTHSWRCFAFERYNGLIQELPTNHRFGDIEKSKFLRFCRMQNLRALYTQAKLPVELHPIINMFEKEYSFSNLGTSSEETSFQAEPKTKMAAGHGRAAKILKATHMDLFCHWMATNGHHAWSLFLDSQFVLLTSLQLHGAKFTASGNADSDVIFRKHCPNGLTVLSPGRIVSLFSYIMPDTKKQEHFAVIHPYLALSSRDTHFNPLNGLPDAAGFLSYNDFEQNPILVPISSVCHHFAGFKVQIPGIERVCLQSIPLR